MKGSGPPDSGSLPAKTAIAKDNAEIDIEETKAWRMREEVMLAKRAAGPGGAGPAPSKAPRPAATAASAATSSPPAAAGRPDAEPTVGPSAGVAAAQQPAPEAHENYLHCMRLRRLSDVLVHTATSLISWSRIDGLIRVIRERASKIATDDDVTGLLANVCVVTKEFQAYADRERGHGAMNTQDAERMKTIVAEIVTPLNGIALGPDSVIVLQPPRDPDGKGLDVYFRHLVTWRNLVKTLLVPAAHNAGETYHSITSLHSALTGPSQSTFLAASSMPRVILGEFWQRFFAEIPTDKTKGLLHALVDPARACRGADRYCRMSSRPARHRTKAYREIQNQSELRARLVAQDLCGCGCSLCRHPSLPPRSGPRT